MDELLEIGQALYTLVASMLRSGQDKFIFGNQPFPWVTHKCKFEIAVKQFGGHPSPGRQYVFMGPEYVLMIIPLEPGPAQQVCNFTIGLGDTKRPQYCLHTGAGYFTHAQENKSVTIGDQHWFVRFDRLLVAGDFDGITRVPQCL